VTDGPFTEAKEVVGGYAQFELKSKEEAVESAVRFMELHKKHWPGWEGETECARCSGQRTLPPRVRVPAAHNTGSLGSGLPSLTPAKRLSLRRRIKDDVIGGSDTCRRTSRR
jgi:hypothetical protein